MYRLGCIVPARAALVTYYSKLPLANCLGRMPLRIARRMGRMTQKTRASHQGTARAVSFVSILSLPTVYHLSRPPSARAA